MRVLVEHALSSDDTLMLAPVVEMVVERDARFGYLNVQQLGAKHVADSRRIRRPSTRVRL